MVVKVLTEATNVLKYCIGSEGGMDLALAVGVLGVDCAAGVDKVYTWTVEGRCKLCFSSSSTTSFPLPSSVSIGEFFSFFSH